MNHKNQTPQGSFSLSFYTSFFLSLNLSEYDSLMFGFSTGETAQIMADFLEVAITTILFLKGVYPRGINFTSPFSILVSMNVFNLVYSLFLAGGKCDVNPGLMNGSRCFREEKVHEHRRSESSPPATRRLYPFRHHCSPTFPSKGTVFYFVYHSPSFNLVVK